MAIHREYTWELECPACGQEYRWGMAKEDHEHYAARFAVHEIGMYMASWHICKGCAGRMELRKAMSEYGVVTMGYVDMQATEVKVDMKYPVEFTPPVASTPTAVPWWFSE